MPPPRRREDPPPVTPLLRAEDLLVAQLSAPGCHLADGADGPVLVADDDTASLVLTLPPQHVGEHAFDESTGQASGRAEHRAAAASRLVFALAAGQEVAFTLAGVLGALPTLRLRVAPTATPPSAGAGAAWTDVVLVPGWRDLVGRGVLTDLVLAGGAPKEAGTPAARALGHARAARLVRGVSLAALAGAGPAARDPRAPLIAGPAGRLPVVGPVGRPPIGIGPRPRRGPRPPTDAETSLEVPYRVQVSPSAAGAFTHPVDPVAAPGDDDRVQLWRTRLTVRVEDEDGAFQGLDDADAEQRIVRAVWSRDLDAIDATADADPAGLEPQSLNPKDRRALVRQTADVRLPKPPRPIDVRTLQLSSLGAWVDWAGEWADDEIRNQPDHYGVVGSYRHQATMGRDQYVRVTYPGFLYPFGHKCWLVKVTERKVKDRGDAVAYLWQRFFIIVRQPVRTYGGHHSPWARVAVEPLVTPDLTPPADETKPFVPQRGGADFRFTLVTTDRAGGVATFPAALAFVPLAALNPTGTLGARAQATYAGHDAIDGGGQTVAFAAQAAGGDTALETAQLRFTGAVDPDEFTSDPSLTAARAVVPAMRHLAPAAPAADLTYSPAFLAAGDGGFGAGNPSQLFLQVAGTPPRVDFSGGSDRSGGFIAPNLVVRGLSRSLGAVGEDGSAPGGLRDGKFDAATFLDGALPKLFGLFSLVDLLEALGVDLDKAPSFITDALDTVSAIVDAADRLREQVDRLGPRLQAEIDQAAHGGAAAVMQSLKAELDAVSAPLVTDLQQVVQAVADLPSSGDPLADAQALVTLLGRTADHTDALLATLGAPRVPAAVRAALEVPAKALAALARAGEVLDALVNFVDGLLDPAKGVTARLEWAPDLKSWPQGDPHPVLELKKPRPLRLAVVVQASTGAPPSVDISAELVEFALNLLPGAPLMGLNFSRIGFRVGSSGKPEVDVVFTGIEFLGPLSFIDTLRRMIPFDAFSDPPYVDVSPEGVKAGFDLALPNVSVGVFSLENIALGADARVPFLGDAVSVGFHFCSKDSPFRLTVMCIGGGGWVELRAAPKGLVVLEMGLEACASLSVDLGVASGSVSISVGVYLRLEADKGLLTAYFRIRGEVDVLGLISASITLELSLAYHFETGKLVGRASLVVEVEVLFFSASVEIVVERQLAGSKGDPVLREIYPPAPDGSNADWSAYCAAFAPV